MSDAWTVEQVMALAPDEAVARAARAQAQRAPWALLGRDALGVWGACQGSAAQPYQVRIELAGPACACTCPSRKQPCKHALGLLLLLAEQPAAVAPAAPPDWVESWRAGRARRASERVARDDRPERSAVGGTEPAGTVGSGDPVAARRAARVAAGLDECERWLADVTRRGLVAVAGEADDFWERPAARLVDAQAPGLARQVRALAGLPASGEGWQARLLERLGRLQLLIEATRRLAALAPPTRADVQAQLGWPVREDDVLAGPGVRDRWLAVGTRVEQQERLWARRTWLRGATTGRPALLLQFTHGREPPVAILPPGVAVDADLAFYPGACPLRALIKDRLSEPAPVGGLPGHATLDAALADYGAALARNPWLDRYPLVVEAVWPVPDGDAWSLRDAADRALPLAVAGDVAWVLLALSGGGPLDLVGEWDGMALRPLSAWADGRFVDLAGG